LLRTKSVGQFESDVEVVQGQVLESRDVGSSLMAKQISSVSSQRIRIQLLAAIPQKEKWYEAAAGSPFLELMETDSPESCNYAIGINNSNQYEISGSMQDKMLELPKIHVESERAIEETTRVLHHLAIFKYFEQVENRLQNPEFLASYTLSTTSSPNASGVFDVPHRGIWSFTIKNHKETPLYMAVFEFSGFWGIANMGALSGGDDYDVVPPAQNGISGSKTKKMRMSIPDNYKSQSQSKRVEIEDVIKVFVTNKPTSFPHMVLPSLEPNSSRSSDPTQAAEGLASFLKGLKTTQNSRNDTEGEWATHSFIVRTTRDRS
jgi:hypothetical protein